MTDLDPTRQPRPMLGLPGRYRRTLDRHGHGGLARIQCGDCHRDWTRTMTRQEFSDYPRRELTLDRWAQLVAAEHDGQHEQVVA